jgi:hypothetical protein
MKARSTQPVKDNRPGYLRQREEDHREPAYCAVCGVRVNPHHNTPCECYPGLKEN